MNYAINATSNLNEIYESLVDSFKLEVGNKREKIAQKAKEMKKQLGKSKGFGVKEYEVALDKIIKDYSKKLTVEEILDAPRKKRK